jgi:hypothetical protein
MKDALTWGWLLMVAVALGCAAYLGRFQPIQSDSDGEQTVLWDRWRQRTCVQFRFPASARICSQADMDEFKRKH